MAQNDHVNDDKNDDFPSWLAEITKDMKETHIIQKDNDTVSYRQSNGITDFNSEDTRHEPSFEIGNEALSTLSRNNAV
ncbi:unnamed protein product [Leptidea sinapis]|uniref:Uncharacterized protein n=1 Tax=Leptidea sinapis TaxID=189913 RepID=A0A5E4R0Z5_9NEOP|nr:unnamed protein product [Leptidea sinapis]